MDVKLAELLEVGFGGRLGHHFDASVVFREGDDVSDTVFAGDEHDKAVEAEGNASMRWGAEFEGLQDMTKEELLFLLVDAKDTEHFRLQIGFVDSEATAADFNAVENDIVSHRADLTVFAGLEKGGVIRAGTRERVMHGIPLLLFLVPSQEREINDP